jgi:hypothetical protein
LDFVEDQENALGVAEGADLLEVEAIARIYPTFPLERFKENRGNLGFVTGVQFGNLGF